MSGKKLSVKKASESNETAIQRTRDIASERGHSMQELLRFNIRTNFYLFYDDEMMKSATKSNLNKELEKQLLTESPRNITAAAINTIYLLDAMANLRKLSANAK